MDSVRAARAGLDTCTQPVARELQHTSSGAVLRVAVMSGPGGSSCAGPISPPPRLFDLALFNHVDHEMVPLRIIELGAHVDMMVFLETEYTHSRGERKPLEFNHRWLNGATFAHYRPIRGLANITAECNVPALAAHPLNARIRKKKKGQHWVNRCRESFSRNALGQVFEEMGGRDEDWALLSDADEIPRAAALKVLRTMMSNYSSTPSRCWLRPPPADDRSGARSEAYTRRQILHRLPTVSLGAIHHFKYTVGCERPWREGRAGATWLKGPVAVPGLLLKAVGAQAARTIDGCYWSGWRNSCRDVKRKAIANASWHMSSMSGGIKGHLQKMRENSAHALYTNDSETNQFNPGFVLSRALQCQHGEDKKLTTKAARAARKGSALHYLPTPWSAGRPLPRYPDVPKYVEREFMDGGLRHFLSWRRPGWDPLERRAHRAWYTSDPSIVDDATLPHAAYRQT